MKKSRGRTSFLFLLLAAFFPGKILTQPVKVDSTSVFREWEDSNGKNTLTINVGALCNPNEPPFDGHRTVIDVHLKNEKHLLDVQFDDPDYQMEMIAFNEEDISFYDLEGSKAVLIPFTYCGNSDSDKKLSYIVLYNGKNYLYHVSFRCNEDEDCSLNEDLDESMGDLSSEIRAEITKRIQFRYGKAIDFN